MAAPESDKRPEQRCAVTLSGGPRGLSGADQAWVVANAERAVTALETAGEVRVRLIGDAEMSEAHLLHCGVAGTTDVITFDLTEGGSSRGEPLDVDLLVCLDEAERQASARGHEVRKEVLLYLLHGMLHCLGHDDHDEAKALAMHAREDEVLQAIGVGATYRTGTLDPEAAR